MSVDLGRVTRALQSLLRRDRRTTGLTLLFVFVAFALQYARGLKFGGTAQPNGDGFYSWMYATSLAFDGDLDLTNDYKICGHNEYLADLGGGRPSNPFYFGPALIWTPILFVVRLVVHLPASAPASWRHACAGSYPQIVGFSSVFFVTLTVWLAYRVASRWVSQSYALVGALVGAFGTTLAAYGAPIWFYCHMWSAFGVALLLLAFVRATEEPTRILRWALFGLAVAFAALMRPQDAAWILLGVFWWIRELASQPRSYRRFLQLLVPAVAWTAGFCSLYWVQLAVYKKIYGVYWLVPQGKLYLQLGHSHPFLMMFNPYSGWFTWTPLVWLGVFGIIRMAWSSKSRLMGLGLLVVSVLQIYISGAALAWGGGATSGQRILTSLAPVVAIGSAVICKQFGEWVLRKKARAQLVVVLACVAPLMFVTFGTPFVDAMTTSGSAVYGDAVSKNVQHINEQIGNPFSLPATEVFSLRYGMTKQTFDVLSANVGFVRNYQTAQTQSDDTLAFGTPPRWVAYGDGLVVEKEGARVASGHGRFLLHLFWPWVTHIRLVVAAPKETRVHLTASGFVGKRELGTMVYAPDRTSVEWALPKEGLQSGFNEIEVDADGEITLRNLQFIDRTVHDLSLH